MVVVRPDRHDLGYEVGAPNREQEGDDAAVTPAHQVGGAAHDRFEDRDSLGRHVVVVEGRCVGVLGPAVAGPVEGHDPVALRQRRTDGAEQILGVRQATVQQQHRFGAAALVDDPGRMAPDVEIFAHRRSVSGTAYLPSCASVLARG